jgi:neutral trehalase
LPRCRYDIILFGHYDAYLAVWGVWGVQCLAEIYAALGDASAAARMATIHARATADFNALFWNATAAAYADWIDVDGRARHYFYVDIAFTAIVAGVANASQAAALLQHYDTRLAGIYNEYNVTPGEIWSPPCNL